MAVRRRAAAAGVLALLVAGAGPSAQSPALDTVLERAAAYVTRFERQLSGIAAEETYTQTVANTSRFTDALQLLPARTLRSDLILVKPVDADRYVELRDVFEVDGKEVRDREARLERLLGSDARDAGARIGAIIRESARYNIGSIQRNINTPLMALLFLQADHQPRFRFRHVEKHAPVFSEPADRAVNDAPVFRVSTEMWTVAFEERRGRTVIRDPRGGNMPARGRFWINPATGAVLISELIVEGGGVTATITVSYQSEPLMGFLVPVEMRETYVRYGERVSGHAVYGRFRPLE